MLLAVGFFGGRVTPGLWLRSDGAAGRPSGQAAARQQGLLDTTPIAVTSVQAMPNELSGAGEVEIIVEERRTIRGNPNDPIIRGLLINSVQSSHSGARLESLEALGRNLADDEIRQALIRAMVEDDNPGVRIKALEALAPHAKDPDVRAALVRSVHGDDNPGMRVMAIDLLTAEPDRELAGVLQQLMATETNNYVRMRCQRALLELDASVDVY
jgi:HEAT repeat protein